MLCKPPPTDIPSTVLTRKVRVGVAVLQLHLVLLVYITVGPVLLHQKRIWLLHHTSHSLAVGIQLKRLILDDILNHVLQYALGLPLLIPVLY